MPDMALMQGNQACVEGALHAGMRFFAGYPITPSTEIAEHSAVRLPQLGGTFIQMEDEIAGIAAVLGASVAGSKAMTATSGPGFSLKQENIGYACMAEIPCVIVNVQRAGPSTGMPTSPSQGDMMQARWGTHGDHPVIGLCPASVKESFEVAVRAFNWAEKYRTPVIILLDEIIGHLREGINLEALRRLPVINRRVPQNEIEARHPYYVKEGEYVPVMAPFGQGERYNITGLVHDEDGFPTNSNAIAEKLITRLMRKVEDNLEDLTWLEQRHTEDAKIAVVCFGGTTRSVMTAVEKAREKGIAAGMFRPVTVWPFPEKELIALAERVEHILVAEHNYGQMVLEVQRIAGGRCGVSHIGKIDGTVLTPGEILARLEAAADAQ